MGLAGGVGADEDVEAGRELQLGVLEGREVRELQLWMAPVGFGVSVLMGVLGAASLEARPDDAVLRWAEPGGSENDASLGSAEPIDSNQDSDA